MAIALRGGAVMPVWLRWLTLVMGLAGLAALAFFPAFLVPIWGLVMGGWMLAGGREMRLPEAAAQPIA